MIASKSLVNYYFNQHILKLHLNSLEDIAFKYIT